MRKTVLLLASMAVALAVACGAVLAATPMGTTAGTDQRALEGARGRDAALDSALKGLVARHGGPPGVIAMIQRGQHREVHAVGVANLKNNRPMRVDDSMRLASTSKAFSGAVALSLVSKGALSLKDTIGELLSDLPTPPPDAWADVTLRQLLNYTSGLPDFAESQAWQSAINARPTQAPGRRSCLLTRTTMIRFCSSILVPGTNIPTRTT
jgi:D-alanyl-D-alanine carboxypeptidase